MAFFYRDGHLHIGTQSKNIKIQETLTQPWNRPTYLYDLDDIERRFEALKSALGPIHHSIHYAMKANSHATILQLLGQLGAGVDTVSGGEIKCALAAGIKPEKIIFSGVAKTVGEIELALKNKIKQINIESPQELERVAQIAQQLGYFADIAFRINPDVNPKTHPYITTGFRENKFGMDIEFIPELLALLQKYPKQLRLRGLTMHIGSLLFDLGVMREAIEKTLAVHDRFVNEGYPLDRLDIGGGLGIRYETDRDEGEFLLIQNFGKMIREVLEPLRQKGPLPEILLEPGRILVARAGLLISEVQYIKKCSSKTFAILDTGMNHLLRPALYQAKHRVLPLLTEASSKLIEYDVVGPICESSDFLAKNILLPEIKQCDLVAIADVGAYGFAMASHYNSHELPLEVCIRNGKIVS